MAGHQRPTITPAITRDDDRLWAAIAEVIENDPELVETAERILRRQGYLRDALGEDSDAWLIFLGVEEATSERAELLAVKIALWAFEQGRRCADLDAKK